MRDKFPYEIETNYDYAFSKKQSFVNEVISFEQKEYRDCISELKRNTHRMAFFPNNIENAISCEGTVFTEEKSEYDWGKDYRSQICFSIKYSEDNYYAEKESIRNYIYKCLFNGELYDYRKPYYCNNILKGDSFISVFDYNSRYEYCILNHDDRIISYIYLFDVGKEYLSLPDEYLPKSKYNSIDFYDLKESFDMYEPHGFLKRD